MKTTEEQRKEKVLKVIQMWANKSLKEIESIRKMLKKDSMQYCLEWNRLETGAMEECKLSFVQTLIEFIMRNDLPNAIQSMETTIQILTDNLLGNDLSSEQGPWDSRSTSNGTNRLAIIRSNVMRLNRKRALQVLELLSTRPEDDQR